MPKVQDNGPSESRSKIVRDVLVFQLKLWVEGFKDLALMPLSLVAACIDILFRSTQRRGTLYSVMKLGDRFEQWVDLYSALKEEASERAQSSTPRPHLDDLVDGAESGLRSISSSDSRHDPPRRDPS